MSTLKVDTLQTTSGDALVPAKAWINYSATDNIIRSSRNVSSITNISTAADIINFSTAMPNTNYAVVTGANGSTTGLNVGRFLCPYNLTTTSVSLVSQYAHNSAQPTPLACAAIFSD